MHGDAAQTGPGGTDVTVRAVEVAVCGVAPRIELRLDLVASRAALSARRPVVEIPHRNGQQTASQQRNARPKPTGAKRSHDRNLVPFHAFTMYSELR